MNILQNIVLEKYDYSKLNKYIFCMEWVDFPIQFDFALP